MPVMINNIGGFGRIIVQDGSDDDLSNLTQALGALTIASKFNEIMGKLDQVAELVGNERQFISRDLATAAVDMARTALRAGEDLYSMQIRACKAIQVMARNDTVKEMMVKEGLYMDIKRALQKHEEQEELVFEAVDTLNKIMMGNAETEITFVKNDVEVAVLSAVVEHLQSARVMFVGIGFLYFLTEVSDKLIVSGISAAVIKYAQAALRNHRSDSDLSTMALGLLANLAASDNYRIPVYNTDDLIDDIRISMRTHRKEAPLQRYGCSVFQHLAVNSQASVALVRGGVHEDVARALEYHDRNSDVVNAACAAIVNMSCESENKSKLRSANLVRILESVRRNHRGNSSIDQRISKALQNIKGKGLFSF